ncbi:hypothetical protein C8R44DRAFT_726073 [Mycena epipterygia]|nr:hypothetical protein C8R44DRAFT_726073 [Mycena epipterygia]
MSARRVERYEHPIRRRLHGPHPGQRLELLIARSRPESVQHRAVAGCMSEHSRPEIPPGPATSNKPARCELQKKGRERLEPWTTSSTSKPEETLTRAKATRGRVSAPCVDKHVTEDNGRRGKRGRRHREKWEKERYQKGQNPPKHSVARRSRNAVVLEEEGAVATVTDEEAWRRAEEERRHSREGDAVATAQRKKSTVARRRRSAVAHEHEECAALRKRGMVTLRIEERRCAKAPSHRGGGAPSRGDETSTRKALRSSHSHHRIKRVPSSMRRYAAAALDSEKGAVAREVEERHVREDEDRARSFGIITRTPWRLAVGERCRARNIHEKHGQKGLEASTFAPNEKAPSRERQPRAYAKRESDGEKAMQDKKTHHDPTTQRPRCDIEHPQATREIELRLLVTGPQPREDGTSRAGDMKAHEDAAFSARLCSAEAAATRRGGRVKRENNNETILQDGLEGTPWREKERHAVARGEKGAVAQKRE